jgi:hypothetical protein
LLICPTVIQASKDELRSIRHGGEALMEDAACGGGGGDNRAEVDDASEP